MLISISDFSLALPNPHTRRIAIVQDTLVQIAGQPSVNSNSLVQAVSNKPPKKLVLDATEARGSPENRTRPVRHEEAFGDGDLEFKLQ
jgi:hypothetical protein